MVTPVTLRGRAATPVRPGLVTKSVLMGETPLATGELVHEASITDLHNAYKELVRRENALRTRAKRLKPMTMQSFKTLFKFSQLLNLVELVREEPMEFPPPHGHLYSLRKIDGVHVVISKKRIFKISALGAEDERSWTNLCKAWIEQWPAPQKAEYLPPVHVPRPPKKRPPKVVKPPEVLPFTPYVWRAAYNPRNIAALIEHLRVLNSLGIESPGVTGELNALSGKISGWIMEADEAFDEVKALKGVIEIRRYASEIRRFERIISLLTGVKEALMDYDIPKAMGGLGELLA